MSRGFADQHHLVVSEGCQIFADLPAAVPVVSGYGVSGRRGAVDHRHRAIDIRDTRAAAGNDDHAIHSTLDQPVDGVRLHGDLAAGVGDQNTITGIDGCLSMACAICGKSGLAISGSTSPRTPDLPVRSALPAELGT